jgi:hypothetical protein
MAGDRLTMRKCGGHQAAVILKAFDSPTTTFTICARRTSLRLATIDHLAELSILYDGQITARSYTRTQKRTAKLAARRYLDALPKLEGPTSKTLYALGQEGIDALVALGYAPQEIRDRRPRHKEPSWAAGLRRTSPRPSGPAARFCRHPLYTDRSVSGPELAKRTSNPRISLGVSVASAHDGFSGQCCSLKTRPIQQGCTQSNSC